MVAEGAAADLVLLGSDPLPNRQRGRHPAGGAGRADRPPRRRTRRVQLARFVPPATELVYRSTSADWEQRLHLASTETLESDEHLVTQRWTCDIPGEDTHPTATASAGQIRLAGTFAGKPVTRSYPLLGRRWLQGSMFDAATFLATGEQTLEYVAIGTSGHGALQLTEFELTRTSPPQADGPVTATLVMPKWRRWWSAELQFDPIDHQLVSADLGKDERITRVTHQD